MRDAVAGGIGWSRTAVNCLLGIALAILLLASPARTHPIAIGARIPGAPEQPAKIDAYARAVGRRPAIVSYYREWGQRVFDTRSLQVIAARGAMPMIGWNPDVPGWHRGQSNSILRQIADGSQDPYLSMQAAAAAAWKKPIMLRFAAEMNGGWWPWGVQVPGNTAAAYIAAWRHVVTIFRAAGAWNVRWVWSPNTDDEGVLPFTKLYPGNSWVDWVALDGYNWGAPWAWESFASVFGYSYKTLAGLSSKPMLIAETGSGEKGGSKAAWITNMFTRELPRFTRVRAVVWFNGLGEGGRDFRFNSSRSAARAFRAGLALRRYAATGAPLIAPQG